jgi:hypothetical protein
MQGQTDLLGRLWIQFQLGPSITTELLSTSQPPSAAAVNIAPCNVSGTIPRSAIA